MQCWRCRWGGAGSRMPPQLLLCGSCPQAGGIHICIIHKETPTLPPNQCQWRGLHRYLSASRVSPSFFVLHSLIHWYLSAKGGLSSCPHGIVFILAQSSSHPDSNGRVYSPNRGLENWEKFVIHVFEFSECLLLKSNSWHYTLNMCSFDIKQTDESKTCWMLEIK